MSVISASLQRRHNRSRREKSALLSPDADFGELLARSSDPTPSVLLLRRQDLRRARDVASLVLSNLATVEADLNAGAIVVIDETRIRIRPLPIERGT